MPDLHSLQTNDDSDVPSMVVVPAGARLAVGEDDPLISAILGRGLCAPPVLVEKSFAGLVDEALAKDCSWREEEVCPVGNVEKIDAGVVGMTCLAGDEALQGREVDIMRRLTSAIGFLRGLVRLTIAVSH